MKSHVYDLRPQDILRLAGPTLVAAGIVIGLLHLSAGLGALPAPRPALDTERTVLVHQAESARQSDSAELILVGDSSCLMDVSARQLSQHLGRPVRSLATFSFLDMAAHASMLRDFDRTNPGRLKWVVLLMHPESLRQGASEPYYLEVLENFRQGRDHRRAGTLAGQLAHWSGREIFEGRLWSRLPIPLAGAYRDRYGFTWELEQHLTIERGNLVDPTPIPRDRVKFSGNAEYRLGPATERTSRIFRETVPAHATLWCALTPVPERFAGAQFSRLRPQLQQQWADLLGARVLAELPGTLPDEQFASTTHLAESSITPYTEQLARALQRAGIGPR